MTSFIKSTLASFTRLYKLLFIFISKRIYYTVKVCAAMSLYSLYVQYLLSNNKTWKYFYITKHRESKHGGSHVANVNILLLQYQVFISIRDPNMKKLGIRVTIVKIRPPR